MSIKAIHVFLISCAVLLSFLFSFWSWIQIQKGADDSYIFLSVSSLVIGLGLGFYGLQFIKKAKTLL